MFGSYTWDPSHITRFENDWKMTLLWPRIRGHEHSRLSMASFLCPFPYSTSTSHRREKHSEGLSDVVEGRGLTEPQFVDFNGTNLKI